MHNIGPNHLILLDIKPSCQGHKFNFKKAFQGLIQILISYQSANVLETQAWLQWAKQTRWVGTLSSSWRWWSFHLFLCHFSLWQFWHKVKNHLLMFEQKRFLLASNNKCHLKFRQDKSRLFPKQWVAKHRDIYVVDA